MWYKSLTLASALLATPALAQERFEYNDGHGRAFIFPNGDASFADEVMSYRVGNPAPRDTRRDPSLALGAPGRANTYVSLGCHGQITLRFDNAIVNIPGSDLYVFEVGQRREPTSLEISVDGASWLTLEGIEGGTSEIDLEGQATAGTEFHYVRLTDQGQTCADSSAGADINAVGAIGDSERVTFNETLLFDTDSHTLKPEAERALREFASTFDSAPPIRVVVEGHTDAVATEEYNQRLSNRRARAVAAVLAEHFPRDQILTIGYGETRSRADNNSEAGRAINRRVEVVLVRR